MTKLTLLLVGLLAACRGLSACRPHSELPPPAAPLTAPTVLCGFDRTKRCQSPDGLEERLRHPKLRVLGSARAPGSTQGARLLTLSAPSPRGRVVFRAKWRSHASSSLTNDPRKEVAAYAIQKLFLDANEYVVPPTVSRCFALDMYRRLIHAAAQPSFPRIRCVYGVLSYWLEHVMPFDEARDEDLLEPQHGGMLDERLFRRNRTYRRSVAYLNLLTFIINHGDTHSGQFVVSELAGYPRMYSVDNTISLGSIKNPLLLVREDWSRLQVPAVPRDKIERLAELSPKELSQLSVFEQFTNRAGQLVPLPPRGPAGSADAAMRWVGNQLKVGLTEAEIDIVHERIQQMVKRVRSEEVDTF